MIMGSRNPLDNMGFGNLSNQFSFARKNLLNDISNTMRKGTNSGQSENVYNMLRTNSRKGGIYDDDKMYFHSIMNNNNNNNDDELENDINNFEHLSNQNSIPPNKDGYFNNYRNNTISPNNSNFLLSKIGVSGKTINNFTTRNAFSPPTSNEFNFSTTSSNFNKLPNITNMSLSGSMFSNGPMDNLHFATSNANNMPNSSTYFNFNNFFSQKFSKSFPDGVKLDPTEFPSLKHQQQQQQQYPGITGFGSSETSRFLASQNHYHPYQFNVTGGNEVSAGFPASQNTQSNNSNPFNFMSANGNFNLTGSSNGQHQQPTGGFGNFGHFLNSSAFTDIPNEFRIHKEDFPALPGPQNRESNNDQIFSNQVAAAQFNTSPGLKLSAQTIQSTTNFSHPFQRPHYQSTGITPYNPSGASQFPTSSSSINVTMAISVSAMPPPTTIIHSPLTNCSKLLGSSVLSNTNSRPAPSSSSFSCTQTMHISSETSSSSTQANTNLKRFLPSSSTPPPLPVPPDTRSSFKKYSSTPPPGYGPSDDHVSSGPMAAAGGFKRSTLTPPSLATSNPTQGGGGQPPLPGLRESSYNNKSVGVPRYPINANNNNTTKMTGVSLAAKTASTLGVKESSTSSTRGIKTHPDGRVTDIPPSMVKDQFGMVGLLTFIRSAETSPKLVQLGLGSDLTTFGLNLNSSEPLYQTFSGPFEDKQCLPYELGFPVPNEYLFGSIIRDKLPILQPNSYGEDLLFYFFYNFTSDLVQLLAALELYDRDWRFHFEDKIWLTKIPGLASVEKTPTYERGTYYYFDPISWRKLPREFLIHYNKLEDKPVIPPTLAAMFVHVNNSASAAASNFVSATSSPLKSNVLLVPDSSTRNQSATAAANFNPPPFFPPFTRTAPAAAGSFFSSPPLPPPAVYGSGGGPFLPSSFFNRATTPSLSSRHPPSFLAPPLPPHIPPSSSIKAKDNMGGHV